MQSGNQPFQVTTSIGTPIAIFNLKPQYKRIGRLQPHQFFTKASAKYLSNNRIMEFIFNTNGKPQNPHNII